MHPSDVFNTKAQFFQSLTAEGDSGRLFVSLETMDGSQLDLTLSPDLQVETPEYTLDFTRSNSIGYTGKVSVGADPNVGRFVEGKAAAFIFIFCLRNRVLFFSCWKIIVLFISLGAQKASQNYFLVSSG